MARERLTPAPRETGTLPPSPPLPFSEPLSMHRRRGSTTEATNIKKPIIVYYNKRRKQTEKTPAFPRFDLISARNHHEKERNDEDAA